MVERNPYETNSPVDVPSFMKEDKEEKEQINMNVFKLKDEEIDDEEDDEEDDETGSYERPERRPLNQKTLLVILLVISILVNAGLAVLLISKGNNYNLLKTEYETYQTTTDKKVERLENQIKTLNSDIDTLKTENETLKKNNTSSGSSDSSSNGSGSSSSSGSSSASVGSFKAGSYKVVKSMYVRTAAGSTVAVKQADMPTAVQYITNSNSTVVEGEKVTVSEVSQVGNQIWGKIGEGCWICLKNGNDTYVE